VVASEEAKLLGEKNSFVILEHLVNEDHTWKKLVQETHLSTRTLSKHLRELEQRKIVHRKFIKSSGKAIPPKMIPVYSLARNKYRQPITEMVKQLEEYEDIEEKIQEYTELFFLAHKKIKVRTVEEYFTTLTWAMAFLTETEILRKRTNFFDDSLLTSAASHSLQHILWKQPFQQKMQDQLRRDLEDERQECYQKIEKAIHRLKNRTAT